MKHIFIVNPTAGKGKAAKRIIPEVEAYFAAHPQYEWEIYVTKERLDGMRYVESVASKGEPVRFTPAAATARFMRWSTALTNIRMSKWRAFRSAPATILPAFWATVKS